MTEPPPGEPFELLEVIGRGGMGVVWKARDTTTGELVAVKLLHAHYAEEPEYVQRIEREVEIAQRIDSPNVVRVLGYGQRSGVPYMVMEYVDGQSLRDLIRERKKLPWEGELGARAIARAIAKGLEAVHAAGIIHRDIKPSNILISSDGTVKLADFGISRAIDLTRVTGSSTMLGTPAYMSPDSEATALSDYYALGVVLYEMLAGVPPFEGESQQAVIIKHIREKPDLGRIPREARPLVAKLLAKGQAERPQDTITLRTLIEREPSWLTATKVAAMVAALALGLSGGAGAFWFMHGGADAKTPEPTPPPLGIAFLVCTPTTAQVGASVECSATFIGSPTSYAWTSDDASVAPGSGATFSPTFQIPGRKQVTLKACVDAACASSSTVISVNPAGVEPPTIAGLGCLPATVKVGETIDCQPLVPDGITSFEWSANDGQPSVGKNSTFSVLFTSGGAKTITLTVCVGEACATAQQTVSVTVPSTATPGTTATATSKAGSAPILSTTGCSPDTILVGGSIQCSPSVSGSVTSWAWVAAGGSPEQGSGTSFSTGYPSAGTRTITATACNAYGCSSTSQTISVTSAQSNAPTISDIGCSPLELLTGDSVSCKPSATQGVTAWRWSASGGNPTTGSRYEFATAFADPGTKTITLTACVGPDCSTASATVKVSAPSAPNIKSMGCGETSIVSGSTVTCAPTVEGSITTWTWMAPEGSPYTGNGGTFATWLGGTGISKITLTACNRSLCTSATTTFTLYGAPGGGGSAPSTPPVAPTPTPPSPGPTAVVTTTVSFTPTASVPPPTSIPNATATPTPTPTRTPTPTVQAPQTIQLSPNLTVQITVPGTTIFTNTIPVTYSSGRVIFGGGPSLTAFGYDDGVEIDVHSASGRNSTFTHVWNQGCVASGASAGPFDLTNMFDVGTNSVTIRLYDVCGFWAGGGALYLGVGF